MTLDHITFAWNIWKTDFLRICQHHAPIQKSQVQNLSKSCISKDVLSLIHQRDHAHKQAVKHNDNHDWLKYKFLRNKVTSVIRNAKHEYYCKEITSNRNNPKCMWQTLKQVLPSKRVDTVDNNIIDVDKFNYFFQFCW